MLPLRSKKNLKKNLKKQQRMPQKTQSKTKTKIRMPEQMMKTKKQRYQSRMGLGFLFLAKLGL